MSENYTTTLQPYNGTRSRFNCPYCGGIKKFVRYINTTTGEYISPEVGRCERINSCGMHYTPRQYFERHSQGFTTRTKSDSHFAKLDKPKQRSFICNDIFLASHSDYEENNFYIYLRSVFGLKVANHLMSSYFVGTSGYWKGSTVFWQVDSKGKVRTGKIMLYDKATGKRVKHPRSYITWAHTAFNQKDFSVDQCLFGEHLLHTSPKSVIAVVESEKTAIIASAYLPNFIWLATGGLSNLTIKKCLPLQGRTVKFFPDLNGYDHWVSKVQTFGKFANFEVIDLLERVATTEEKKRGLDIADYLLRFDVNYFK